MVLAGCGGLQAVTSGQIGCAEEDIQIIDKHRGWADVTWTAECHGKRFYCSSFSSGAGEAATSQVTCKEAVAEQVQAAAAPPLGSSSPATSAASAPAGETAGCHYDTQCKGDRLCIKGECAAPTSPPTATTPTPSQPATTVP
jgi:hypothetical protein